MELKSLGLKTIYLDLNNDIIGSFFAKEGEFNSRGLLINVLSNGKVRDTTGVDIFMYALTADSKVYERKATIIDSSNGKYELIYPANMLVTGKTKVELRLKKGKDNISTKTFILDVDKAIVSDNLIEGVDEPSLIEKLLEAGRNEEERIINEDKRKTNETERINKESLRVSQETERNQHEDTRESNESTREANEDNRKKEEIDRVNLYNQVKNDYETGRFKGDKGEPFVYEDFTPKQLEGLRGPKGETGSIENLAASNIQSALGFLPKNYKAGTNINIDGDVINAEVEELSKVTIENALGYTPQNPANDSDTITTINGKTGEISKEDIVALGIASAEDLGTTNTNLSNLQGEVSTHEADEVSQREVHGLRVNNEKLEYYTGAEWKIASGGIPVGNVSGLSAEEDDAEITLMWTDPDDRYLDDLKIAEWQGTKIIRKEGSYPVSDDDGVLVVDNTTRNQYSGNGYKDTGLTNDETYYYMAFPYTEDAITVDGANRIKATPTEIDPNSWSGIQKIVRKGIANDFFTVGDQIMANYDGVETVFEVIGIDVETPSDTRFTHSMTLQTKSCLYNRAFDPDDDNRYINSPIRAHLNNEFLTKLDTELSAVLGKVDKKVAKRDNLGGGQYDFSDKVFLLSRVEVGLGTEGTTTGESVYPFYDGVADAKRIKELDGSPRHWWLSSPNVGNSYGVRGVGTDGSIYGYSASNTNGVSPACVII